MAILRTYKDGVLVHEEVIENDPPEQSADEEATDQGE